VEIEDTIEIKASPQAIFSWLLNFQVNYTGWHPNHVKAKWTKGESFAVGSVLYTEEYIGTHLEKMKFQVIKVIPDKSINYKVLFPKSLICAGGSFSIEPSDGHSIFTATLKFPWGRILSKLFPAQLKALKIHMREEGENLKTILEKINEKSITPN